MTLTDSNVLHVDLSGPLDPNPGAIRAFGARLIAGEVASGGSGQLPDRVDAVPHDEPRLDDPECPQGKRDFAEWVNTTGYPFIHAYVNRLGLPYDEVLAMKDGRYAVTATCNGRSGYVYVCMFQMPEGMEADVAETPIPAPPPVPEKHEYELTTDLFNRRFKLCTCGELKSDPIHKVKRPRR